MKKLFGVLSVVALPVILFAACVPDLTDHSGSTDVSHQVTVRVLDSNGAPKPYTKANLCLQQGTGYLVNCLYGTTDENGFVIASFKYYATSYDAATTALSLWVDTDAGLGTASVAADQKVPVSVAQYGGAAGADDALVLIDAEYREGTLTNEEGECFTADSGKALDDVNYIDLYSTGSNTFFRIYAANAAVLKSLRSQVRNLSDFMPLQICYQGHAIDNIGAIAHATWIKH